MAIFEKFCKEVEENVKIDLAENKNVGLILAAFNTYQEEEKDGVDYIFNIDDADDLICCIKGGMTAGEIAELYNSGEKYFKFGQNYEKATPIKSPINEYLIGSEDLFVPYALLYAARGNGIYSKFYNTYVTDYNVCYF